MVMVGAYSILEVRWPAHGVFNCDLISVSDCQLILNGVTPT